MCIKLCWLKDELKALQLGEVDHHVVLQHRLSFLDEQSFDGEELLLLLLL